MAATPTSHSITEASQVHTLWVRYLNQVLFTFLRTKFLRGSFKQNPVEKCQTFVPLSTNLMVQEEILTYLATMVASQSKREQNHSLESRIHSKIRSEPTLTQLLSLSRSSTVNSILWIDNSTRVHQKQRVSSANIHWSVVTVAVVQTSEWRIYSQLDGKQLCLKERTRSWPF